MITRQTYEDELKERQIKHLESLDQTRNDNWRPCLHDQCQRCHGTGRSAQGPCIHGIACNCPKHSFTC